MGLLSAMTIECAYGIEVAMMLDGYRKITGIEGIAGVDTRGQKVPATGRHGTVNRTRFRDERIIVVTCLFVDEFTMDPDRAWQEYDAVAVAANSAVGTERLLRWTAGARNLQSLVKLDSSRPAVEVGPAKVACQFTFSCADPRAYSQTEQSAFSLIGSA